MEAQTDKHLQMLSFMFAWSVRFLMGQYATTNPMKGDFSNKTILECIYYLVQLWPYLSKYVIEIPNFKDKRI